MPDPSVTQPSNLYALIGYLAAAFFGAGGMKLLDRIVARRETDSERYARLEERVRQDLREDIEQLRTEIRRLSADVEGWRQAYYELHGEHVELVARYEALKKDHDELKAEVVELETRVGGAS